MSEHPRYIIKTPADFLTIPQEKIERALKDFYNWIEYNRAFRALAQEIPALAGVKPDVSEFRWIDDGKHDFIPVFKIKKPAKGAGDE
jgi:hypothetical protein